ncbi:hypothetical protein TNIN_279081 [Trichonephila inaurata madagascariensis]|uniref:Uncharacterized protein n=1 Tax=Trichonephila inaurata madagascariensis TaxID=2747483 RepID=A0A8X7CN99_9ARAC|nr:hypothetical protein TNIN_279081 [Trichonephila inaurata madagascariensis]
MKWITRFKEGGVNPFKIQPGRGVKPKLSGKQQEEIKNVIAEEGANLRTCLKSWMNEVNIRGSGGRAFKTPVKKQDCIDQGEENSPRQSQNSSFWARLAVPKRLRFFPRIISLEETEMLGVRTSGREGF